MKGHLDVKDLEKYKKSDLQKLARELGVSDEGTVKELAARCAEVEVDAPDEGEPTEAEKTAVQQPAAVAEPTTQKPAEPTEPEQAPAAQPEIQAGSTAVRAIQKYRDLVLDRVVEEGEQLTVSEDRAEYLAALKLVVKC